MKKFLLSIAAAFLAMGAMAQSVVTEINTENLYTLECRSGYAHSTTRFIGINDNGVINGQSETSAYVTFEEGDEAGRYYIKVGEKYINCDGTNLSASTEKSTAWILGTVGNTVTFNYPGSTKYLNNNGTTCTDGTITGLQANNHPNGPNESNACSTWEMKEYENTTQFLTQVTANDLMSRTTPTNIAIKNISYTNNRWFVANTGATPYSAEEFTNNAIFVWEPVQAGVAGSYYLKKGDTYMQTSSPKDFGTIENAAVFTATAPGVDGTFNGDGDSNLYITGSNDANLVRFVKGDNWINVQNGAGGTPVYNTGTGGWTIHYVYEVTEVASFKANISNAGYATFYAPAEVAIPENVKAYYIAAVSSESATLTQIENVIPANTAVILEGAEGEYTFNVSETGAAAVTGNLLKGTVINTNIIGEAYVLGDVKGEIGLYKTQMADVALSSASGSVSVFLNNAYKAYLPASAVPTTAQGAASFSFRFEGGTTGISEVKTENENAIYDLTGRRVEAITEAGIYIVNGKKVLVK